MGKFVDLTGQKFGKWTVLEYVGKSTWLCRCECGTERNIEGANLRRGKTTSCGCISKLQYDLTGQKFGRLTVVKRAENKGRQVAWLCQCECGIEKVIMGHHLKSGNTTSCGCLKSEKMKQLNEEQWQDEDFRKKQSEKMKEQVKKLWEDEEMKWKMHYKGGITPISIYLRSLNSQWYEDCKQKANYTCQLTGKHGCKINTHHLKSFNTIVIEAHDLHNIKIKDQVKDYTQEELKLLEEYVGSWHKDNGNAVVLSEDVHELFHSLYGFGENTPEQYIEFKERYLAGEFKEILK